MENISIVTAEVEEHPHVTEFTKNDFLGHHPTMAALNYDPFPNAKMEDVVRKETVCRKLILDATLKVANPELFNLGISLVYQGHTFSITDVSGSIKSHVVKVKGTCFLTPPEPMKVLARLREMLAASNPKT